MHHLRATMKIGLAVGAAVAIGAWLVSATSLAEHPRSRRSMASYAGEGVAVEYCMQCHNVGRVGPRSMFSGAPPFSQLRLIVGDPSGNAIRRHLEAISTGKFQVSGMPPIHLTQDEMIWLAEYIADMDTR